MITSTVCPPASPCCPPDDPFPHLYRHCDGTIAMATSEHGGVIIHSVGPCRYHWTLGYVFAPNTGYRWSDPSVTWSRYYGTVTLKG